ncbi:MAG: hypothetical protein U0289_05515 [Cyclobacteriaceae bacterium]|jgi:hypothetical protein|nr:hypothetical protein [Cytophagales bacterium]HNP77608.1 hypothetical protein [Cyclobacteriaceae bacterium]HQQ84089.1 hypothetical protein [Cyclobacteriaceae bacterium]
MNTSRSSSAFNVIAGLSLEAFAVLLYNPINNYFYNRGSWPLGPFILAVIYAAGIYFIFKSSLKQWYKYLLSYWWMALVAWYGIQAGVDYVQEWRAYRYEAYLIPEGYHGKIEINFGQPAGIEPRIEADEVVLTLDTLGRLDSRYVRPITRFFNEAYPRFYYVDANGVRTSLKRVGEEGIKPEEVFVEFLKNNPTHREFLICTQAEHKAYF